MGTFLSGSFEVFDTDVTFHIQSKPSNIFLSRNLEPPKRSNCKMQNDPNAEVLNIEQGGLQNPTSSLFLRSRGPASPPLSVVTSFCLLLRLVLNVEEGFFPSAHRRDVELMLVKVLVPCECHVSGEWDQKVRISKYL